MEYERIEHVKEKEYDRHDPLLKSKRPLEIKSMTLDGKSLKSRSQLADLSGVGISGLNLLKEHVIIKLTRTSVHKCIIQPDGNERLGGGGMVLKK